MILLDTGMRKMPDKCSVCKFFRVESQMYCTAVVGYTTVSKPYERRPVWCPLHEVTDTDTISRPQWIPCSDRLPDEEVLCCDTRGEMIIGYPYQDEESNTGYSAVLDDIVMIDCTAWMPLPEPYHRP